MHPFIIIFERIRIALPWVLLSFLAVGLFTCVVTP